MLQLTERSTSQNKLRSNHQCLDNFSTRLPTFARAVVKTALPVCLAKLDYQILSITFGQ